MKDNKLVITYGYNTTGTVQNDTKEFQNNIFNYLITLMGANVQLRLNHWQTCSFAEHKLTDLMIDGLSENIDKLGESALGIFGRPELGQHTILVTDNKDTSTSAVICFLLDKTCEMHEMLKSCDCEDLKNILADIKELLNKSKFLETLK